MDSSMPLRRESCTPKSRSTKVRLNRPTSKSTPTRNRKRFDPQRRLEVAETRRNGACARCREKKVRCTPAQHKSSANGSPESTRDDLSNSSRLLRDSALTGTNNGSNIFGVEGCVPKAKEDLKVSQRHIEKFARFIETWESSKKAFGRNRSSNDDVNIPDADSCTMTRGSSQQSERSLFNEKTLYSYNPHANETDEGKKGLSHLGQKKYIYRDQAVILPTSIKATNGKKTMLDPKDRKRVSCPKSDLVKKAIWHPAKEKAPSSEMKCWMPSLTGENEPWAAFIPSDTLQFPRQTRISNSPQCFSSTRFSNRDESVSTLGKRLPEVNGSESPRNFATGNNLLPNLGSITHQPVQTFRDFQLFDALDDDFELYGTAMGSGFDFAHSLKQRIPQELDNPFVPSVQGSESLLTQTAAEYIPVAWDAARYTPQVHLPSSNIHNQRRMFSITRKEHWAELRCRNLEQLFSRHGSPRAPELIIHSHKKRV